MQNESTGSFFRHMRVQATTLIVETVIVESTVLVEQTSDDDAILFTANDYFSGNDRYSGTKSPDRFFHYNGRCLYSLVRVQRKNEGEK